MNDKISELIIKMKNALNVKKEDILIEHSSFKESVLKKMQDKGYIDSFKILDSNPPKKNIRVKLAYNEKGESKINDLKRVSKLSQRIYYGYKKLLPVKYGHGSMFLSTPVGILTDQEAKKVKVGGEALFKIW